MQNLPSALHALSGYKQFVLYKKVPSKRRPGKTDKFPMGLTSKGYEVVDAHDPNYWLTSQEAINLASQFDDSHGVGFVFTENDPFFFIDIDDCAESGEWSAVAQNLLAHFHGGAVEVSQSGTGLHIIGSYSGPEPVHSCKNIPLNLELYTSGRFVALTGSQASGNASQNFVAALGRVIPYYFPFNPREDLKKAEWTNDDHPDSRPIQDDQELILKALEGSAKNAAAVFGGDTTRATFRDLWTANTEELAKYYPDNATGGYNASSADSALAQHLAWWCGGNCERIERLMRQSGLVREKWDKHKSYMYRTITGVCMRQSNYYNVGAPIKNIVTLDQANEAPVIREGYQYMPSDQQIEYFKGCVYVASENRILTPNGIMLKQEQFNAMYGGYLFGLDTMGDKTSRKAWETFTESQALMFPKVDSHCFRPKMPQGAVMTEYKRRLVNTYVELDIEMEQGDITPFLNHLKILLPNERDQTILISYMATCVQYKGHKIQWAPLLQGVQGNGKTLFSRCLQYAIGSRYSHWPRADEISEKFNAWLFGNLLICVEDIYVPGHKQEIIEVLKPMITSEELARRAMQTDQSMHDLCCNFMFNTNHRDALKNNLNERRYCIFFSAQQHVSHLTRDGLVGDYFPNLYRWLRDGKGYSRVAHFLYNYDIPDEFNGARGCQRGPITSSTVEAAHASMGSVEQEILDKIDEGAAGFANGWVASCALDDLIDKMRKSGQIPRNKRRELMNSLGYDWHPALTNGRVNNPFAFHNGQKPKLFIQDGHIHKTLSDASEVVKTYCAAQGDPLSKIN